MSTRTLRGVLQQVRRAAALERGRALGDHELLERFAAFGDEAAFAVLLRRHGPLVLGACRRALGNAADAEDACQATFLVLARKADTIRKAASLAGWLHRVAAAVSANLRREQSRRRRREQTARAGVAADPAEDVSWGEVRAALDEELARLPERYRAPLVLCYLDGRTRDEAARSLGVTPGALRGCLERGRALLRDRLARRGVALSAALLATAVAAGASRAGLPSALALSIPRAAVSFAAGALAGGAIPTPVLSLAREALKAMSLTRVKLGALAALCAGLLLAAGGALTLAGAPAQPKDPPAPAGESAPKEAARSDDADGDGLPDFQEVHKYRTDPRKKDTAGKGVPDGDWRQRREFTYSVRAVLRVMPPYNLKAINDDYQDVRVLAEKKGYAEVEVVVYPLNTNAEAIRANPNWKKDYAGMKEYLAPGVTTNWDEAMRKDLLRELVADGIDPDKLSDKEVVERVSTWLFRRAKYRYMFCTFYVGFDGGKPAVLPGLEKAFEREKGDPKWTVRDEFEHELLGKEMFANRCVGTCTSSAVLQTTALRALGVPTRMVLCVPLADASDPAQVAMVEKGLTHHRVRRDAYYGLLGAGGFTSHTFCEAFVGGRWRRLNYTTLGQNVLDPTYLGLMVHVHTFRDLSDANLAATWGARYGKGERDEVFRHDNPYRLMEVSDHFGKYAEVPNPAAAELTSVTIGKAYWAGSKEAPAFIRDNAPRAPDGAGRLLLHGEEWLEDAGNYLQYKAFLRRADPEFVLKAKARPDVKARLNGSYYTAPADNVREMELDVPAAELEKMAKGLAYTIHPANSKKGFEWKVREGVTITRE